MMNCNVDPLSWWLLLCVALSDLSTLSSILIIPLRVQPDLQTNWTIRSGLVLVVTGGGHCTDHLHHHLHHLHHLPPQSVPLSVLVSSLSSSQSVKLPRKKGWGLITPGLSLSSHLTRPHYINYYHYNDPEYFMFCLVIFRLKHQYSTSLLCNFEYF